MSGVSFQQQNKTKELTKKMFELIKNEKERCIEIANLTVESLQKIMMAEMDLIVIEQEIDNEKDINKKKN